MDLQQSPPEAQAIPEKIGKPASKPWHRRWWLRSLAGLVIFLVLFFIALPFAIKYGAQYWLKKNGADEATIDSVRYNPFLSRLSLRGLAANFGGQTLLSDGTFTVDLGLSNLLHRDIHIQEAAYHDLLLDIEQKSDGSWRFGTYSLTPGGEVKTESPSGEAASPSGKADSPPSKWIFSARNVTLGNCEIRFRTPEIDLTLVVDEARLNNFSTSASAPAATFDLQGKLNGEAVAIHLDTVKIAPSLDLRGQLNFAAFDLANVKKYVEEALPDFAGTVSLNGKAAYMQGDGLIKADYDGAITITKPLVGNNTFRSAADTLSWNGAASYHLAQNDHGVTTKGTLASGGITVGVPDAGFSLKHDQLTLTGDTSVPIAPVLSVEHDGTLTTQGSLVNIGRMKVTQQRLNWQGKTNWSMPKGVSRAVFTGALATDGSGYENGAMRAGAEGASVAELSGDIGKKIAMKTLAASGLSFISGGKEAIKATVKEVNVGTATTDDLINWQVQKIGVKNAGASLPGAMPLALSLVGLNIDQVTSAQGYYWRTGTLALDHFAAHSSQDNSRLASVDTAKITGIMANKEGKVEIGEVDLGKLLFLGADKKNAVGSLDRLLLRQSAFSLKNGFTAASLDLRGFEAHLEKDKEGTLNALSRLQASEKKTPERKAAPAEKEVAETAPVKTGGDAAKALPFPIRLGQATLDGHIFFSDKSLPLKFTAETDIESLTIRDVDSTRPEHKSAVELVAQLADRAPLNVSGGMALFGAKPDIALDIHLKNYPLSHLSPYTAQAVGTALASGELKIDGSVGLKDDFLKVKNDVLLQKLETKTLSPELAEKLNNQLPLPLDAALALLRDSQGNISLSIPVEGELSSLNVGLSSIIITALSKAIVPAASAYLVYTLGPYGALAYVGTKVGQKMMQVSLPPAEFAPGQADLTLVKDDYLQRVGKILADRPAMDLQLTPKVVANEFNPGAGKKGQDDKTPLSLSPKLTKKLEALGQQRAEALRQHLHDRFGVDMNRLMISETQIIPDGKPEVLLSM
ncbi:MAG TPA: hypothetical protein DEB25_04940 [Desulfobulbaceae bacterium]|nr:hypothetical protein [Desulfobulbaceae bacterium]